MLGARFEVGNVGRGVIEIEVRLRVGAQHDRDLTADVTRNVANGPELRGEIRPTADDDGGE
jgi:hypothetical protein